MENYRERVQMCAEKGRKGPSDTIYNRSPAHAAIILEFVFKEARVEVDILTGHLNEAVYGEPEVMDSVIEFLKQGGRIRLLVEQREKFDPASHRLMEKIKSAGFESAVTTRYVPPNIQDYYTYHFAVGDKSSYRMEGDRHDFKAIAQFGDKDLAAKLSARFEEIWQLSKPN